jgi:hypothetical protein
MRPSSTFTLAGLPLSVKEMVRSMKTSPARAFAASHPISSP